ncbi:Hypothetical predicted protein [Xyrichtys novacula]|uniref:Uncharacterized protein n=1 Tax=Xyrichtys novacula TaxID=13765 RepID=A0AAV1GJQ0_XYRNO|nr:Hypothetical predicted protein [Xyrichtys novacula]
MEKPQLKLCPHFESSSWQLRKTSSKREEERQLHNESYKKKAKTDEGMSGEERFIKYRSHEG